MFKTAYDVQAFTDTLIHIAEKCIPKSSTCSKRNRPLFDNDVKNVINKRKSALRNSIGNQHKKIYSMQNKCEQKLAKQ